MADIINNVITNFKAIFAGQRNIARNANSLKTLANSATQSSTALATLTEVSRRLNVPLQVAQKSFNKANLSMSAGGKIIDNTTGKLFNMNQTINRVNKSNRRFEMGFLSLMFASMALNRAVGGFLRNAITAYNKASGESSNFRKETNKLVAAWEFFKFSIIDALSKSEMFQSFVIIMTNLVNKFNELSESSKAFIAIALGITFLISLFGMVLGQIGLAKGGFLVLGDIGVAAMALMGAAATALGITLGVFIAIITAVIITAIILWQTNFGGFRDFVKATFRVIWETIKAVFKDLVKLVKLTFGFIKAIFQGDFDKATEIARDFLNVLKRLFLKALIGIGAIIVNVFALAWNLAVDSVQLSINLMIFMINKLIKKMNEIPGVNVPLIPKIDFSGIRAGFIGAEDVLAKFGAVDRAFATSDIGTAPTSTPQAQSTNTTTTIDQVNFSIDGATESSEGIADKVIEKLNNITNAGLDSSNI